MTADESSLVSSVRESILKNKDVVEKIRKLPEAELQEFLGGVRVQSFASDARSSFKLDNWLDGLSSFDGKRAYVNKRVLRTDREGAKTTIEHEYMHNLSRWRLDCPRLISPAKNKLLRSLIGNEMIEGGDFYEEQVYRKPKQNPSPFCLTQVFPIRHNF